MFDFFDSGIMEGLEHRLVKLTRARTGGDITEIPGKSLALTSQVSFASVQGVVLPAASSLLIILIGFICRSWPEE